MIRESVSLEVLARVQLGEMRADLTGGQALGVRRERDQWIARYQRGSAAHLARTVVVIDFYSRSGQ
jgi:hypothetical protein